MTSSKTKYRIQGQHVEHDDLGYIRSSTGVIIPFTEWMKL